MRSQTNITIELDHFLAWPLFTLQHFACTEQRHYLHSKKQIIQQYVGIKRISTLDLFESTAYCHSEIMNAYWSSGVLKQNPNFNNLLFVTRQWPIITCQFSSTYSMTHSNFDACF